MKEIKIIDNSEYAVKKAHYALDFQNDTVHCVGRTDKEIDAFFDLDGAALCEDMDGNLYAVENYFQEENKFYITENSIYQKVKKREPKYYITYWKNENRFGEQKFSDELFNSVEKAKEYAEKNLEGKFWLVVEI